MTKNDEMTNIMDHTNKVSMEQRQQNFIWEYYQTQKLSVFEGNNNRLDYIAAQCCRGQRVLNIGIGSGYLEKKLLELGVECYAIDPSEKTVDQIKLELQLGSKAQTGYAHQIPFPDNYFNIVTFVEVIEHLPDKILHQSLDEIYRVIKVRGFLIGTTPARENLSDSIILCPHCKKMFHRWGHHQQFTVGRIRNILKEHNFEPQTIKEKLFPPWNTVNWKNKILLFIKLLFLQVGIHSASESIYFMGRKK